MIITRTPFRISFAGGGSDIPAFYSRSPGAALNCTIDKYMYLMSHPYFNRSQISLKYSKNELCNSVSEIAHPIIRSALGLLNIQKGIEINSSADIPAGTGLGSSSAFTVGLLHNLNSYLGKTVGKQYLAENACQVEIGMLSEPVGKQDQYAASFGGFNVFEFNSDGAVKVSPLSLSAGLQNQLAQNLLLFYTGDSRSARSILRHQSAGYAMPEKFEAQQKMVSIVWKLRDSLRAADLSSFGQILHDGWALKKTLAPVSNERIDDCYQKALDAGASGGKLLGAGGGGFLLFYCEPEKQPSLRAALSSLSELSFGFDSEGSKLLFSSKNEGEPPGFYK